MRRLNIVVRDSFFHGVVNLAPVDAGWIKPDQASRNLGYQIGSATILVQHRNQPGALLRLLTLMVRRFIAVIDRLVTLERLRLDDLLDALLAQSILTPLAFQKGAGLAGALKLEHSDPFEHRAPACDEAAAS